MRSLEELRNELDRIDPQIIQLYEERMSVCEEVGEIKIEEGRKVFDRNREQQKLAQVTREAKDPFYKKGLTELFEQLMSQSRKLQYQLLTKKGALGRLPFIGVDELDWKNSRVVFQGTDGAYSQAAMHKFFSKDVNSFHVQTFRDAMEAIEEGSADFAVLPIENSSAGMVSEMYDLLEEFENYIVGEVILPINHYLVGTENTTLESIERVYSHPQALMQCSKFLDRHGSWQQIGAANTAVAAKKILNENDPTQAAICSEHAAEIYGLKILEEKISICFEVAHESGTLYHLLSHFIYNDLNMTKIESRPIEGKTWEYRFFVDFEGNMGDAAVKNAIRGLREESKSLKILGNY